MAEIESHVNIQRNGWKSKNTIFYRGSKTASLNKLYTKKAPRFTTEGSLYQYFLLL